MVATVALGVLVPLLVMLLWLSTRQVPDARRAAFLTRWSVAEGRLGCSQLGLGTLALALACPAAVVMLLSHGAARHDALVVAAGAVGLSVVLFLHGLTNLFASRLNRAAARSAPRR
jgi:hypothetical protein